ncbi:MAG: hypothetical protein M3R38_18690, partial [Actinomycetota bacterium]|nr:hypothetical protein [Actinomycetota bacterium]
PYSELTMFGILQQENRKVEVENLVRATGCCAEEAERAFDAHGDNYEAAKDCLLTKAIERLLRSDG